MTDMGKVIILFGVSGCGKSLIGKKLSLDLKFKFIEGDDLHSNENIEKMNNNIPLNDNDREIWIKDINAEIYRLKNKNDVSLPCFSEALSYINQTSSLSLSTKLIQAQRNQFGSHKININ